jgi:hypothetical protein
MSSIPLPALSIKPPENPLDQYAKALSVKSMLQGQQLKQQQITGAQLENQNTQQAITDRTAMTKSMTEWDGKDMNDLPAIVLKNGGSANAVFGVRKQLLDQKQTLSKIAADDATTNSKNLETYKGRNDQIAGSLESLVDEKAVPDDQLHTEANRAVNSLLSNGLIDQPHAQQLQATIDSTSDPAALRTQIDHYAKLHMGASQLADEAQKNSDVYKNIQQGNLAKAEALQKGSPLTAMENDPTHFTPEKLPGTMAYLQSKINDPKADPVDVARATRLLNTAKIAQAIMLQTEASKKATDQAIQDGDPNAAAKLLVDGTVAPSQLISSRKPEFAQKAFTAAQQMQPGWSAQRADADFAVAKSPANVAFFGSAKSLTDRAGTLDQLSDAAKDIPKGQIPVFNTIADVMKASTGSGPIAKYASILLGVADDYSKVMGGGNGSDTSRNQALQLVPAADSPEQRAAAIEGIRGAVGSQLNSRIGSNPVLKKMYGNETAATPQPATKTLSMSQIQQAAKDNNVSVDEATRQAKAAGYTVQ